MPGYERPEGGWSFDFDGMNTVDAPDQIAPTEYPVSKNIRALPDHHVETRPGYDLLTTIPDLCPPPTDLNVKTFYLNVIT